MKLVEILARDWKNWPIDAILPISQDNEGGLYVSSIFTESGKTFRLDEETDIAEDMSTAEVTRPQWQAERDRMSKMEALIEARDNPPSTEPTYEQQLWDRVAIQSMPALISHAEDWTSCEETSAPMESWADIVKGCAQLADAFMAERAKRVGK